LQCLVWPEHHDRALTLQAALNVAADIAPRIEKLAEDAGFEPARGYQPQHDFPFHLPG
jgi:hypothetical protein